ncbi:MAG: Uma2 family endonuclease [Syntrophobacteraceae bacterium]
MEWREVVEHPSLRDLPFKIETNEWGEIVMTPATVRHGKYQARITILFERLGEGERVLSECGIETCEGVKVADIAWGSSEFHERNKEDVLSFSRSPEIVVEVKSPSNSVAGMERKKRLYLEAGAKEVWFCDKEGNMRFFNSDGELERSEFFKEFPRHVDIL